MTRLTKEEVQAKLEAMSQPILRQAGIELVELNVAMRPAEVHIEFIADRPTGGITMGECSGLNRRIVEAVDLDGFLGEDYSLEFCSPGLDRPLKNAKDFSRNAGRNVRFMLSSAVEGKREWTGVVKDAGAGSVEVMTKHKVLIIPYNQIIKAVLVI
jgi:ribosome maturation factor RimP